MDSQRLFQPRDFWRLEGEELSVLTGELDLARTVRHDGAALASVTYAGERLAVRVSLDVRDQHLAAWLVPAGVDDAAKRSLYELARALGLPDPPPRPDQGAELAPEYARELLAWIARTVVAGWIPWNESPDSLFPSGGAAPLAGPVERASVAANEAFGSGDFSRVVALLSAFEGRLSKTDAARLRYCRKELARSARPRRPRGPAVRKLLLGIGGWLVGGLAFYGLHASGFEPKGRLAWGVLIALALPGSVALVGAIELATGRSFASLARSWDALAGWQRGVLGLGVCALAFAAMLGGVALVFGDLFD